MDVAVKAAAIGISGTVFVLIVKKTVPEISTALAIGIVTAILSVSVPVISSCIRTLEAIADSAGISGTVLSVLIKTVAISIVARIGADICRDGGQTATASAVELCGAVTALYVSLPLIEAVVKTVEEML